MEWYEQSLGIKLEERVEGPKYSNIYEVLNESEYVNDDPKPINAVQVILLRPRTDDYVNPWFRAVDSVIKIWQFFDYFISQMRSVDYNIVIWVLPKKSKR